MKIGYLDCFSGISGDMLLGALVDAGVPIAVLQDAVSSLGVGARLSLHRLDRSGIDAAKIDVLTSDGKLAEPLAPIRTGHGDDTHSHDGDHFHEHAHEHGAAHVHGRSLSEIEALIRESFLAIEVQATALKAFRLLGAAEAKIHNIPIESIHFHEVGAIDAIADIVAAAAGCHWLQIDSWLCSPLNVGEGHVHCAHGKFPVPAPATLELLRDLPIYSSGVKKELVTPTGAALLRALAVASSGLPAMRVSATGYGAGSREIPGQPNVLRLILGEAVGSSLHDAQRSQHEKVGIIETTIDDATPELLAYAADLLLAAGASDVHRTPVQMKKGRIGVQLTVLCSPSRAEALQKLVFQQTTTLGLRYREEEKKSLVRDFSSVETEWGSVRIKIGSLDGEVVNYAPEYEDCRRIAEQRSIPLKQVMQAALSAYLSQSQPA